MSTPSLDQPTEPSSPTPSTRDLVYEVIQDVLIVGSALGLAIPAALQNPTVLGQIASGVAGLVGVAMSLYDKWRTARAVHGAAVASARLRRAVRLV